MSAPWWMDLSCPEITYDDLDRARALLADREAWNETVAEAHNARSAAGLFADWNAAREWFYQLPAVAPSRGEQITWARRELRALRRDIAAHRPPAPETPVAPARRLKPRPAIAEDRQLEIAIAALNARASAAPDRDWSLA